MKRLWPLALLLGACSMSPQIRNGREGSERSQTSVDPAGRWRDIEALEARIAVERAVAGLGPRSPQALPEAAPQAAPKTVDDRPASGSMRCRRVGAAASAICDAAEHICRIARELDEQPAARSCRRALGDCDEARRASSLCTG